MKKKSGLILIILGVIAVIAAVLVKVMQEKKAAASIGIIGGADGPTAIFIAGSVGELFILPLLIGVVLLTAGIIWWRKRK